MLLHLKVLEPRFSGLVEMFLLEVYRCKLCQFTSSIKKAAACLQIEEPCSAVLTSLSYSKNDDKAAQSLAVIRICLSVCTVILPVRSLSSVRSALTPPLMQALCSSPSKHALVRGPTNVDSVHIVAFRRKAWTFTYSDFTLAEANSDHSVPTLLS
ncbi:hypothetical protein AV530_016235 [Patagioenas fasciata monilis]|uniref:Uncharacterized protein n=1 Tax=Patagioenas fasciata monilis TaxID=372326 RepID=A0A1V4JY55_PATFA|nr:hypothetical protein AV530_016235 [Patagioenas fasciata monilis]